MVSYAGNTITTDAIGNTLWDGTFTYTWQHGRQLASATKTGTTVSYQYNAEGIRTSKTVNGILHTYDLSGTSIVRECIYNSTGTYVATELRYYYDAKGAPAAMHVFKKANANATPQEFVCYFATNLQGDIVALYDEDGNCIASYTYDAWGNNLFKTSTATTDISATNAQWLMNLNPFRYRGYYYDTETGLYYLQSRYYNPTWGRFINADRYVSTGHGLLGYNMYAYCNNSPVMHTDKTGHIATSVLVALIAIGVLAVTGATIAGINSYKSGNSGFEIAKDIAVGFGVGAAIGGAAVCLSGIGLGLAGVLAIETAAQVFAIGALGVDFFMYVIMPIETGEQGPGIEFGPIEDSTPQPPPSTTPHPGMK